MTSLIAASALFIAPAASFASPNLVINGSFETGDFSGFSLLGATAFTGVTTSLYGVGPTDGLFEAYFGSIAGPNILSQTIGTVAGASYVVSFDLYNFGSEPTSFDASFGGVDLLKLTDSPAFGYTTESFNVTAAGSTTLLDFIIRDDPWYFLLDNISVTGPAGAAIVPPPPPSLPPPFSSALPEAGVWAMMILGFGIVGAAMRRRPAVLLAYA